MSKGKADRLILRCFEAVRKKKLREPCPRNLSNHFPGSGKADRHGKDNPRKMQGKRNNGALFAENGLYFPGKRAYDETRNRSRRGGGRTGG